MLIGLLFGTFAYRSGYAAIFDPRYNHIPLPPFGARTRFSYSKPRLLGSVETLEGKVEAEVDKLVVWSWWKSGTNECNQEKEIVRLRNIRSI
jgi:diacylglycerol diphosphate phosphatase/phosphatidate phosphatase